MCLRFLKSRVSLLLLVLVLFVQACAEKKPVVTATPPVQTQQIQRPAGVLRVTADPNNLPFSNERREGFENKLAELIAKELDATLQYSWRAQRRGFFRETLKENRADLVLGVPAHFDIALTTAPYYRSTFAFVYRKDRGLDIHSLDDPVLRTLKIGVQMIGYDAV